jgi:predicted nucleotide-binding protein
VIHETRSLLWRELKDFVEDRLALACDEYNQASTAGLSRKERLATMLDNASFAFLVCTAEDELMDGKLQARANVIHEVGLFQGRLGFERAIVLLEEGCDEFSNIAGVDQIRFPLRSWLSPRLVDFPQERLNDRRVHPSTPP